MSKKSAPPSSGPNPFFISLAGGIIVLAALAAYANSFSGPFLFDDVGSITNNPTILHFGSALSPPTNAGTGGRPLFNLTFALNYALGGMDARGYHAFNLLIHMLAGLTLFGVVRRTLASRLATRGSEISNLRFEMPEATLLALAVAVIWVVHPLQTEAVAYISQRAESLMGLFYLLTLYCFVRSADETGERRGARGQRPENRQSEDEVQKQTKRVPLAFCLWPLASILACLLGVLTKEIIVTAPVMVFLYDRTFVAGSFREAWRLRWKYYLGLAGTWLLLAHEMTGLGQRAVGFDEGGTDTWWTYALTSCRSAVLYLKLAIWPHPLVFDYGHYMIQHASEAVPYALILAALLLGTVMALWRWPVAGFAGAWFFLILAPTTSVVPIGGQPMAEHRMYLPLAAVVGWVVLGLYKWMGRRSLVLFAAMAVGLGCLTIHRNKVYHSRLAIWTDTVAKQPDNARAHNDLGNAYLALGRLPEATTEFQAALRIYPDYMDAHYNLGGILAKTPARWPEAISHLEAALQIDPDNAEAHNALAGVLMNFPDRLPEAMGHLNEAVRIKPDFADAHNNLAIILAGTVGGLPDAISEYETALRIKPDFAMAHYNLATALSQTPGRQSDAITEYQAALRLKPDLAQAHTNLGIILANIPGRLPEAIQHFEAALQLEPDSPSAQENLGMARHALEESQAAPH
ncbi:MAG TPA: tetratricopeptide repeat protein [Opitutaceae bacterium]|jgi:tetratricopeptide (TPR) repeat protein|nr:tetratricopeptide repeat protein [Opitutaceae bacterium]